MLDSSMMTSVAYDCPAQEHPLHTASAEPPLPVEWLTVGAAHCTQWLATGAALQLQADRTTKEH